MDPEGFDSNPYDGSTWFVPQDLPPRELVEPGPFILEGEDDRVADGRVEGAWRRDCFTEGRWIKGADGYDWCLPVVGEAAWDAFSRIRELMDIASNMGGFVEEIEEMKGKVADFNKVATFLLFQLLEVNYHATSEQLFRVLAISPDEMDFNPLVAVMAHLNASPEVMLCRAAEQMRVDRNDAKALRVLAPVTGPLLGWHKRDGHDFRQN
jgi:hypothetical protein